MWRQGLRALRAQKQFSNNISSLATIKVCIILRSDQAAQMQNEYVKDKVTLTCSILNNNLRRFRRMK